MDNKFFNNLFEEDYERVCQNRDFICLSDVLKMNQSDEKDKDENKINFSHIHNDKDGKFNIENFNSLSQVYLQKEKIYKRYEFRSQLQAHFTLLMWKQVCSLEGEQIFTNWIKILLIESESTLSTDESEEDINPDLSKYIGRQTLRLFYEILNVKITHGIDFQSFFDLIQIVSENLGLTEDNNTEDNNESHEDFIHINVLEFFCKNFIRGFSKLIVDLGFDSFMLDEIE